MSSSSEDEEPPSLIMVGIDFGTTYSGVAWACSEQPDDIKTVTNWQCHEYMNQDKEKAPTEIAYVSTPTSPTNNNNVTWGYGIPATEAVKWFKLLLLDEGDMKESHRKSPQIQRGRELLQRANKTPVQAVADYLRFLWNHALDSIKQELGEIAVEGYIFRVVITVPAVWPTKAVKRMTQAAMDAGILQPRLAGETTLHFVSEPEAAALATFEDMKTRPNFQTGDCFVVCDAGGGTVDLISYKVHQAKPMQLRECVEGSGDLCGAVFLDQDFEALMEQLLGDFWQIGDNAMKRIMNVDWENGIKRGFDGSERNWNVTLPYECTSRGAPPFITLSKGHVGEIFENVTSQIRALVNDQIRRVKEKEGKWPKAVILVGGFGSCRYLFNLLKMENKGRGIEVYKSNGAKPWTAICRGAVLKALTNSNFSGVTVNSRISRQSYGTRFHAHFIKGFHREEDKYYSRIDGREMARNQMEWYLRKGDDIEEKKPVLLRWHCNILSSHVRPSSPYNFMNAILSCNDETPPPRFNENTVKTSCTIQSLLDISGLPDLKGRDGLDYKRVNYDIEMTVIGTALEFSLIYEGKRIGKQNVDVEFEEKAPQKESKLDLKPLRAGFRGRSPVGF
ncbi:actin-like ATPase domain-containing protein [Zopfia rhizophila CBS 207.26]|uniref:Actin-like ATPase domain-containing protein n=1 Tax=Zopfia rhizophila CBS 207.26 TaxID=1314779 RepID=A0A6A6ESP5_9PEZI|nr:actin-like ATPase domain-containing protein [Zopfia rhizophila CBS 207.26]